MEELPRVVRTTCVVLLPSAVRFVVAFLIVVRFLVAFYAPVLLAAFVILIRVCVLNEIRTIDLVLSNRFIYSR